jgi:hypothetical protein
VLQRIQVTRGEVLQVSPVHLAHSYVDDFLG